jgi:hypothetical protein
MTVRDRRIQRMNFQASIKPELQAVEKVETSV